MNDPTIHLSEVPAAVRAACATVLSYAIARGAEYGRTEAGVLRDLFGLELLRGSPPGDTPAPDLAKLQSVIEGALLEWTRGDPNDLLTDEEWARTVAQFLAARLCNAGSHAVFFEGGAAAGSSAPECESCHALRNQLQTAQTKLRLRGASLREETRDP